MKRLFVLVLLFTTLLGCKGVELDTDRALNIRQQLLKSSGCQFNAQITADYQDALYSFALHCDSDASGNVAFTVIEPTSIENVAGVVDSQSGKLTFDDKVLAFPHLTDGMISPVSAPWFFVRTLRSGYIESFGPSGELSKLTAKDSYDQNSLELEIFFNGEDQPVHADFFWHGTRILSMEITDFVYL